MTVLYSRELTGGKNHSYKSKAFVKDAISIGEWNGNLKYNITVTFRETKPVFTLVQYIR